MTTGAGMRGATIWVVQDIADALDIPRRRCEDMLRDPDCPKVEPFAKVGNSRVYDPLQVPLDELRAFLDGADARAHQRQEATLRAQAAERAERLKVKTPAQIKAEFLAEQQAMWRENEQANRERSEREARDHKGGFMPFSTGSR